MSDMIGLLRFGMPLSQAPVAPNVEAQSQKAGPAIAAVSASSGGGQAAGNYTSTPRPTISPQFVFASAGDPAAAEGARSVVVELPKPFDPDVLTGPPPTFEATLLQLEAHLRMSLARIDAARHAHPMDQPQVEKPKVEGEGKRAETEPAATAQAPSAPAPGPMAKATPALEAAPATRADAPVAPRQSGGADAGQPKVRSSAPALADLNG